MVNVVMRALWMCPSCRRRFANRNRSHACGRHDLAHPFDGKDPAIRAPFDAVRRAVCACGPVKVLPEKPPIAFQARMSFAPVSRTHVHHFRLLDPGDIDAEFRGWLREAYAVGAQKHLRN